MSVSTRTPEGEPNRCPLCNEAVCIEPSEPHGDATCPSCGLILWFPERHTPTLAKPTNEPKLTNEQILEAVNDQLMGYRPYISN